MSAELKGCAAEVEVAAGGERWGVDWVVADVAATLSSCNGVVVNRLAVLVLARERDARRRQRAQIMVIELEMQRRVRLSSPTASSLNNVDMI